VSGYLLDTNIVSELRKGSRANQAVLRWFASVAEGDLFLSVLVVGEIRCGIERIRKRDRAQATALERWLGDLVRDHGDRILEVTREIASRWGEMSAQQPISVVDGLLAATAAAHSLVLVTRNIRDVAGTGVKTLNPFD
jgi:hypothetical protein